MCRFLIARTKNKAKSGITACRPDLKQLHVRCRALAPHSPAWAPRVPPAAPPGRVSEGLIPSPNCLATRRSAPQSSLCLLSTKDDPSTAPLGQQGRGPQPVPGTEPSRPGLSVLSSCTMRLVLHSRHRVPPTSEGNGS